jgi:hypothetical protein
MNLGLFFFCGWRMLISQQLIFTADQVVATLCVRMALCFTGDGLLSLSMRLN